MTENKETNPFANDRTAVPDVEGDKDLQAMKASGYAGRFGIPEARQSGLDQVIYRSTDGSLHHSTESDWDKVLKDQDAFTGLLKVTKGGQIINL